MILMVITCYNHDEIDPGGPIKKWSVVLVHEKPSITAVVVMVCPQLGVSPAMDSYIIMIVASESGHFNIRTSRPNANAFLLSCFYHLLSL